MIERVAERGVEVTLTDDARELIGNMGYDPTYGARPLRRVIQKQLTDRLALALLEGELREGDTVRVDAVDGELVLGDGWRPRRPWPEAQDNRANGRVADWTSACPRGPSQVRRCRDERTWALSAIANTGWSRSHVRRLSNASSEYSEAAVINRRTVVVLAALELDSCDVAATAEPADIYAA